MSSYQKKAPWDRSTKYWCRYCQIHVQDNKPSRRLHESGAKHKDNVQKYLRRIDKEAEAKEVAEAKLRDQLERIERAAALSYGKDVGGSAPESRTAAATAGSPRNESQNTQLHAEDGSAQVEPKAPASGSDGVDIRRPVDIGIAGAWEVVEEEGGGEEEMAGCPRGPPDHAQAETESPVQSSDTKLGGLPGAEWIDEEDNPKHPDFDIVEKTIAAVSSEDGASTEAAADASEIAGMFKKRRAAGGRNTRNQRRKV
ncbi:WW domain binding protein 4 [Dipsacomyces acuminosporus]|nr:WW domain binding protein 4 [Dipsacomyces acuminosporus]